MKLHRWSEIPLAVRTHLADRLRDREITVDDLDALRVWIDSQPDVPEGNWYKDFGRFKICGEGPNPKTFLTEGQVAFGREIDGEAEEAEA